MSNIFIADLASVDPSDQSKSQETTVELSLPEAASVYGGGPKSGYIHFAISWYCYGIADAVIGNGSHIQASYEQMEYGR